MNIEDDTQECINEVYKLLLARMRAKESPLVFTIPTEKYKRLYVERAAEFYRQFGWSVTVQILYPDKPVRFYQFTFKTERS